MIGYAKDIKGVLEDCERALQSIQACVAYDGTICKPNQLSAIVKRDAYNQAINRCMETCKQANYSTQRRCFMIKTDPTMLVCNHTPGPWNAGSVNAGKSFQFGPDAVDSFIGEIFCQHRPPASPYEDDIRLVCAAPPLLKIAQKLLLWMEECMAACDFNQDDMDLYHELRQTIRTAGGFSSETHWWQGPCICSSCGHAWQGVVEIPVEATSPQVPLECSECHQMTGGPT